MKRLLQAGPVRFVMEMVDIYFEKHVSRAAAELAYFLILSFFPVLICVNALVGMLHLDINSVMALTKNIIPEGVQGVLADYLGYIGGNQSGLLTAGIIMTLFSASAAIRGLMNMMDELYGRKGYAGVHQIVASVLYSILLLVTIYASGVVLLTGSWFFHLLEQWLPIPLPSTNWPWLRFVLLFCLVFLFILIIYRVSAPKGGPRPPLFTGAILAAGALVGASGIFSWFIGMSTRYSLVYGSLASVIIMMVWLYLCGNILILGNVFNCVWYRHKMKDGR